MVAQKGRDILIQVEIEGVPTAIGCMRTQSISINNEEVDISCTDSEDSFGELLGGGAGIRTVSMTGNGIFTEGTGQTYAIESALAGNIEAMSFFVPGLGTFEGNFYPSTMEITGEYNNSVQFNGTFRNAGPVTFTSV